MKSVPRWKKQVAHPGASTSTRASGAEARVAAGGSARDAAAEAAAPGAGGGQTGEAQLVDPGAEAGDAAALPARRGRGAEGPSDTRTLGKANRSRG